MKDCAYTVRREGQILVVDCATCGPSRLDRHQAEALIDPVLGVAGPVGRFQVNATRAERGRLAELVRAELEAWPDPAPAYEVIETRGDYQRLTEGGWWKRYQVTIRAWFTEDRRRRRLLSAWWEPGPRLPWIMLNPSLAGSGSYADNMDPTVRRVRAFTTAAGWPGFDVLNLYDLISPDPAALALEDPAELGENRDWLADAANGGTPVVVAWGAHPKATARALEVVRQVLEPSGAELLALVTTRDGHPGHPLYVKGSAKLKPWRPRW